MAEPFDPNSVIGSVRSSPKDIQQMANILKDMGVTEYEPRVLNQMLEFSYRYLTTILDDAYLYSTHAKKKCVDSDDVKLAINLYQDRVLATPPARDVILEVARQRNSMPLPQIKSTAGLRLPPDRHSLIACNYRLKSGHKKRVHTVSRLTQNSISSSLGGKNATMINVNKPSITVMSKNSANLSPASSKPAVSVTKPAPTPIIKFSDGKSLTTTSALSPTVSSTANSVPQILMPNMGSTPSTTTQILMPTIGTSTASSNQLLMPSIGITTASGQLLMPTVGITSASSTQIHMPTVGPTDIKLPNEGLLNKREPEEDDDYDME